MTSKYAAPMAVAAAGVGAISWALITGELGTGLILAGASLPLAVLLTVARRLGAELPVRSVFGGAIVGAVVALLGHGLVLVFGYAFLLGFAEAATDLLDSLRVDPRLTTVLSSPWVLLVAAELIIVAPVTEEFGKALGARWSKPASARAAFLTGVAAGAGFAVVENVLYAAGGAWAGGPWTAILLGRLPGAAVHPLASGLVVLGWWGLRNGKDRRRSIRLILGGIGVHAVWNGSLVALAVAEIAFEIGSAAPEYAAITLAYVAAMGAVAAAALWGVTVREAAPTPELEWLGLADGRMLGAWAVLGVSLLVPVAMILLAFPDFYRG